MFPVNEERYEATWLSASFCETVDVINPSGIVYIIGNGLFNSPTIELPWVYVIVNELLEYVVGVVVYLTGYPAV